MGDIEKCLTVQIFGDTEISDLDFETRESLPGWNEPGADCVYCKREIRLDKDGEILNRYLTAGGAWVSIEQIEKLLADFKSKGATHVKIEHHSDHSGYMFDYGVLRLSTQEDIATADLHEEKHQLSRNESRIKQLENELAILKGK